MPPTSARAQTAADAAALAGTRDVCAQLEALALDGIIDAGAIDMVSVRGAAEDYARRNGGRVTELERLGVDLRVEVTTNDKLGAGARPPDSQAFTSGSRRGGRPARLP